MFIPAVEHRSTANQPFRHEHISALKVDLCAAQVQILFQNVKKSLNISKTHTPKIIQKAFGEQIYVPALLYLSHYVIRWAFEIQISLSLISHHNSVMI